MEDNILNTELTNLPIIKENDTYIPLNFYRINPNPFIFKTKLLINAKLDFIQCKDAKITKYEDLLTYLFPKCKLHNTQYHRPGQVNGYPDFKLTTEKGTDLYIEIKNGPDKLSEKQLEFLSNTPNSFILFIKNSKIKICQTTKINYNQLF